MCKSAAEDADARSTIYNAARLQWAMEVDDIDAVVLTTSQNITYVTSIVPVGRILKPYNGYSFAVVLRHDPSVVHVVTSAAEADQLLDSPSQLGEVRLYGTFFRTLPDSYVAQDDEARLVGWSKQRRSTTAFQALDELLHSLGVHEGRIGVDEDGMRADDLAAFEGRPAGCRILRWSGRARWVRKVKTPFEIAALSTAARSNVAAIEATRRELRAGISELELKHIFEMSLVEQGATPGATMIRIGRYAVMGQRAAQEAIVYGDGDLVWFDSDSRHGAYWADIARTLISPKHGDYELISSRALALRAGMRECLSSVVPGMTGAAVFKAVVEAVQNAGFPQYQRQHVGHGIGLEPYETPILAPDEADVIEEGCVLSVETPYYEYGLGALHFEDPVLISSRGNRFLTDVNY